MGTATSTGAGSLTIVVTEICNNGIDDDGDGLIDNADPDCAVATTQLYLSDPSQALDRVDPVATADATTAQTATLTSATTTTVNLTSIADNDIWAGNTSANYGNCDIIYLDGNYVNRSLLKFDLSGIPGNATINSATLSLVKNGGSNTSADVNVHRITADWAEGTRSCSGSSGVSNYNRRLSGINWGTAGGDYNSTVEAVTAVGGDNTYSWSVVNLVQDWVNGTNANFGMLLKYASEGSSNQKTFGSRENSTASDRPELSITYTSGSAITATFTQDPVLCSSLEMPTGGDVTVNTYLSNVVGGTSSITAASTSSGSSASVPSGGTLSFSHTPGTGTNRLLLVSVAVGNTGVSDETAPGTVTGVTFGGTSMTLEMTVYSGVAVRSYIYSLLNPSASPAANVVITIGTKTSGVVASATTFDGVDQATPLGTPVSFAESGYVYSISGNVSSATGELVYSTAAVDEYSGTQQGISAASGQTELWNNSGFNYVSSASSTKPGASSVGLTYDFLDYEDACMAAVSIKPATSSSMPANPDISAVLKYGTTTFATLTNPTYDSGTGLMTWSQTLSGSVLIPTGEAISMEVTNNEPGISFKIDYDSQTKPSKIELPVTPFIDITSYAVYDAAYPSGSIITNAVAGPTVYLRAVVTDPFGYDDITSMDITITPTGSTVAAISVATAGCTRTYEYAWNTTSLNGTFSIPAIARAGYENTVTGFHPLSFDLCSPEIGIPVFTLGASSAQCQAAGSVTYTATSSNSTGISYSLDATSTTAGNSINTTTGEVTYVAGWKGTSIITATATGCAGPKADTHTVTVNPVPTADAGTDVSICNGASTILTASASSGASPYTYAWDNSLGSGDSKSVGPSSTTTYTVTVTDNNGCTGTSQVTVTVNPVPTADAGTDVSICNGASTILTASASSGASPYSYAWDNSLGSGDSKS
ncbi:MAG: DNRLRE domain-containing protein, partial [Saprospiraceae bacterium]|nr:DNRLRE domain-containing protein [Saprospiraceae bacterium]MCF8250840.1 DNRLRE domain-containing protein [Saprospiraceae bacterium]MCF8312641.1 DNRLRE domain-containing protein [Saprospiraceae bacterium]